MTTFSKRDFGGVCTRSGTSAYATHLRYDRARWSGRAALYKFLRGTFSRENHWRTWDDTLSQLSTFSKQDLGRLQFAHVAGHVHFVWNTVSRDNHRRKCDDPLSQNGHIGETMLWHTKLLRGWYFNFCVCASTGSVPYCYECFIHTRRRTCTKRTHTKLNDEHPNDKQLPPPRVHGLCSFVPERGVFTIAWHWRVAWKRRVWATLWQIRTLVGK